MFNYFKAALNTYILANQVQIYLYYDFQVCNKKVHKKKLTRKIFPKINHITRHRFRNHYSKTPKKTALENSSQRLYQKWFGAWGDLDGQKVFWHSHAYWQMWWKHNFTRAILYLELNYTRDLVPILSINTTDN